MDELIAEEKKATNNKLEARENGDEIGLFDRVMSTKTPFTHELLALSTISGMTHAGVAAADLKIAKDLVNSGYENVLKAKPALAGDVSRAYIEQTGRYNEKKLAAAIRQTENELAMQANSAAINEFKDVSKNYATLAAESPLVPRQLQIDQHLFFNGSASVKLGRGTKASDYIGTVEEIAANQKLFKVGTREANVITMFEYTNRNSVTSAVLQKEASAAVERQLVKLAGMDLNIAKSTMLETSARSFGKGFVASVASMGAGYAADHVLGSSKTEESIPRMIIDGCLVPAALMGGRYKAVTAGALFATSRAIGMIETSLDRNMMRNTSRYEAIKPNLQLVK